MSGIVVIFQNWKKIQKPKLQSNATVLLRWQHAARRSPPSTPVEETSSMQGSVGMFDCWLQGIQPCKLKVEWAPMIV
jgi:hypothetical protein